MLNSAARNRGPFHDATRTTATIYQIRSHGSIRYADYHFDVNGKSYVGQTRITHLSSAPAVGDQLTVVYSQHNPYESAFDEPRKEPGIRWQFSLAWGAVLGSGCAFLVWWLLRRPERS
ncbi:DUF3592 domain-containing protein [Nocardia wallacei]|uniref:DUF3592 domain-containing protein n=1 Tax=Nocardia wallacei TaxID=480035 RepID=UPI003CC7F211